jgi:hypothetical protein
MFIDSTKREERETTGVKKKKIRVHKRRTYM